MYDEASGLFSYSTDIVNGAYVNDFAHPAVHRYTINSIAGIQRAMQFHDLPWNVDRMIDLFLARQLARVTNVGDKGLLLYLLTEAGHPDIDRLFGEIETIMAEKGRILASNVQEISWVLLGLTRYAVAKGTDAPRRAAERCFKLINRHYFNADTLLPYYASNGFRKRYTSFGGVVYFLMACGHYAKAFDDVYAETIFKEGVRRVIGLQGPLGEWPWFTNANTGKVIDWYQVYTVHQDSMAMLFLLQAHDRGVQEAREAIIKSYRWNFGENELGVMMVKEDPFCIYRSIRRKGGREREKRFLRALVSSVTGGVGTFASKSSIEVNPECRSYHIGWILYAWAGRTDFTELTELELLPKGNGQTRLSSTGSRGGI